MSENEWHVTRTWQHEPSTFLKCETTGSLSSEYYKLYSVANVDDSTRFDSNRTTRHSKWQSVIPDANYIQYDGSSFVVTSRSNQVESCRFDNIDNPPSQTLAEYFLSLLQIDFRYAFPSVLQIDIRYDGSFDSSRFDNIFNPLSQTLAEYFLSLLQIDCRYAFPCFKRWFLRTPVSQHHLAANRFPVWRFAAVWVYWTTLLS